MLTEHYREERVKAQSSCSQTDTGAGVLKPNRANGPENHIANDSGAERDLKVLKAAQKEAEQAAALAAPEETAMDGAGDLDVLDMPEESREE